MKVYKLEVLVIDFEDIGVEGVSEEIENAHYGNHCISPEVKSVQEREVEWSDDHPLNKSDTCESAYKELFNN